MNKRLNNSKILKYMTEYLILSLNELKETNILSEFDHGAFLAYLECLEILSKWTGFKNYHIFDIEKHFLIK